VLRIRCPWCGERDESEFRYRGDARVRRPAEAADAAEVATYVYERDNPRGWHVEWWLHTAGCRMLLQVVRHTVSHRIAAVGHAGETLPCPPAGHDA
jgi:heterotetrameric sarcosine oxidase delta subunit